MDRGTLLVGGIALAAALLSSCSREPPKCASDETKAAVKSLFLKQLPQAELLAHANIDDLLIFDNARAVSYDDKIKRLQCQATLSIAGKVTLPLEYDSQLDDSNHHVVAIDPLSWADSAVIATVLVQALQARESTTPPQAPTAIASTAPVPTPGGTQEVVGTWEGELEGSGTMEVTRGADGLYVALGVQAPGGCGGALEGAAARNGNRLTVQRSDDGRSCTVIVEFADDTAQVTEGDGCTYYHGAACGFSGTLTRRK